VLVLGDLVVLHYPALVLHRLEHDDALVGEEDLGQRLQHVSHGAPAPVSDFELRWLVPDNPLVSLPFRALLVTTLANSV